MPYHPPIPGRDGHGKASAVVSAIVQAEKLVQIALILPCAAFIGWLGGAWLGSRLHAPWLAAVGVAFGGAAGLVYVIRLALNAIKAPSSDDNGPGAGKGSDGKPL